MFTTIHLLFYYRYIYVFFISSLKTIYRLLKNNYVKSADNVLLDTDAVKNSSSTIVEFDNVIGKKCKNQVIKLTNEYVNCKTLCGGWLYSKKKIENNDNNH